MARSGANQTLSIGGTTISGVDSGFTGLNRGVAGSSYQTTSGGLTTTKYAGYRVNSATFSVDETANSQTALLCQTGVRKAVVWDDGDGSKTFDAILEVTRSFNARAQRTFDVTLYIDGAIT